MLHMMTIECFDTTLIKTKVPLRTSFDQCIVQITVLALVLMHDLVHTLFHSSQSLGECVLVGPLVWSSVLSSKSDREASFDLDVIR